MGIGGARPISAPWSNRLPMLGTTDMLAAKFYISLEATRSPGYPHPSVLVPRAFAGSSIGIPFSRSQKPRGERLAVKGMNVMETKTTAHDECPPHI